MRGWSGSGICGVIHVSIVFRGHLMSINVNIVVLSPNAIRNGN